MYLNKLYSIAVAAAIILAVMAASACKSSISGNKLENVAPETYTVVDTIIRTGDDRLTSQVHIRWWGSDPDGVVTGFEYSFDLQNWYFTAATDSVFILSPPAGMDTIDFTFSIRAIDNDGAKDLTPASVTYPIKNSPPVVAFVSGATNPTVTFPVVKLNFQGSDPDGPGNILHYEIVLNDTTDPAYILPANATAVTLIGQNNNADSTTATVYINNNTTPESGVIEGLRLNDTNRLFIRAVDISEAESVWKASYPIYVKKVTSNILLVNAYTTNISAKENFYTQQLTAQGINDYEILRLFETSGGNFTQQSPDNLTQSRIFEFFDVIVWFSNSAAQSLPVAQKTTGEFFNSGGKMIMSVYISSSFDEQSQFLDFTPVQSLVNPSDTTLILDNNALVQPQAGGWPVLKSTGIVGVVKPLVPDIGTQALYNSDLLARDDITFTISNWNGPSTVMLLRQSGGTTNFIFSSLELDKLDGNGNIDDFFQKVLIQEFGL